jgi:redox-sensitive bicupin YhaK (pirin superfamily)
VCTHLCDRRKPRTDHMITLCRGSERHYDRRGKQEVWSTFVDPPGAELGTGGFGLLQLLDDVHVGPGAGVLRHSHDYAEIISYVCEGALAYEDPVGRCGVVQTGEFRRMVIGRGTRDRETNASRCDAARVFQLWLRPAEADLAPVHEQRRFSAAQRRGNLCVIASPDARRGSLRLHEDALVYSSILEPGQHVVHELARKRSAWLHLVKGEVTLGDLVLTSGDGVGITDERAVSFTVRQETEILLLDLAPSPTPPGESEAAGDPAT